jgi:hypothetical protein
VSLVSVVTAIPGRPLRGLSPMFFSRWIHSPTELTSHHTLFSVCTGLELSAVRNAVITLPSTYAHHIRYFTLLLCWTHVTDWAPMILVELDSVAIRGEVKKLYPSSHLKEQDGKYKYDVTLRRVSELLLLWKSSACVCGYHALWACAR